MRKVLVGLLTLVWAVVCQPVPYANAQGYPGLPLVADQTRPQTLDGDVTNYSDGIGFAKLTVEQAYELPGNLIMVLTYVGASVGYPEYLEGNTWLTDDRGGRFNESNDYYDNDQYIQALNAVGIRTVAYTDDLTMVNGGAYLAIFYQVSATSTHLTQHASYINQTN